MATPGVCEVDLIEQVRQYPHLYDSRHKDYKDMKKCTATWSDIAETLGCPDWKVCKERWRTLRDVYVRNRKSVMTGEKDKRPRWRFFDQMQFLNAYIIHKPIETDIHSVASPWVNAIDVETVLCEEEATVMAPSLDAFDDTSNATGSDDPQSQAVKIKEEVVEWIEEEIDPPEEKNDEDESATNGHYDDSSMMFVPFPSRKRRRHHTPIQSPKRPSDANTTPPTHINVNSTSRLSVKDPLLCHAEEYSMRKVGPPQSFLPEEEEELFGRYVAAAIRKLSAKSKSHAKMRIQRVLFELEECDRNGTTAGSKSE